MIVTAATGAHRRPWLEMRAALWDDAPLAEHSDEIDALLAEADPAKAAFVAVAADGPVGFAEAALRHDHVNGCETSPVAFLEGIYVRPDHRRRGIAALLLAAVAEWGHAAGCTELGSDTELHNAEGAAFHAALGFAETERVIFFRKAL